MANPEEVVSAAQRLIHACVYLHLRGPRHADIRPEVCQQTMEAIFVRLDQGFDWETKVKLEVWNIARNKSADAIRRLLKHQETTKTLSDLGVPTPRHDPTNDIDPALVGRPSGPELTKAMIDSAAAVQRAAENMSDRDKQRRSDMQASAMTEFWLQCLREQNPLCNAEIGRQFGVMDRRVVDRTFRKVREGARAILTEGKDEDYSPW